MKKKRTWKRRLRIKRAKQALFVLAVLVALLIIHWQSGKAVVCAASVAPQTEGQKISCVTANVNEEVLYPVPLDAELQAHIIEECSRTGIDPAIIMAMAFQESSYNASAIGDNGNSFGLCQIQPRWHQERMDKYGVTDLLNPYQNVTVCVDYLEELLARYDGNIGQALTAYNQGSIMGVVTSYAKDILANSEALTEGVMTNAIQNG